MNITFSGTLWYWKGPAPWYFITVPAQQAQDLKAILRLVTYGWGMIPVQAQIGDTKWTTSMFPKDDRYILPVKANVRNAEGLQDGDLVQVQLDVRV